MSGPKPTAKVRNQRTLLLVIVLGAFILWAYVAFIAGPLMREAATLNRQVSGAREDLRLLQASTTNEGALREQYEQVSEAVKSLRRLLPAEEEIPTVIEHLSGLASETGIKIQAIFPQRVLEPLAPIGKEGVAASAPIVYREIPIQIDALAGYHQLGTFLSLVESSEKPMQIATLTISANQKEPKRHLVKLLLRCYFAVSDAAPTASTR